MYTYFKHSCLYIIPVVYMCRHYLHPDKSLAYRLVPSQCCVPDSAWASLINQCKWCLTLMKCLMQKWPEGRCGECHAQTQVNTLVSTPTHTQRHIRKQVHLDLHTQLYSSELFQSVNRMWQTLIKKKKALHLRKGDNALINWSQRHKLGVAVGYYYHILWKVKKPSSN